MNLKRKQNGFTIIEVVLVLAIAGLIFLMVFIALPALQRSQRDTARKSDVGAVASAVVSFTGNNRGTFPATADLTSYAKNVSSNTDPNKITVAPAGSASITPADGAITVVQGTVCDTSSQNSQTFTAGTTNQFTVTTMIEAGGGVAYCQNN